MKRFSQFVDAVLAGISIAIGGTVYLSCENKVVGAVLFCLGLFAVCTFGFNLFTGKVGYIFEQPLSYTGFVAIVWLGNLAGTVLMGNALRLTRIAGIAEKAAVLCQTKLDDSVVSIFILSVLCNILMFVAVEKLLKKGIKDIWTFLIFACAFVLCYFTDISTVILVVLAGIAGYVMFITKGKKGGENA